MAYDLPAVPAMPRAGHIARGGVWHPGARGACPRCNKPARPYTGPVTRHHSASSRVTAAEAAALRDLRDGRVLPPLTSSSRIMIERLDAILAGQPAIRYELNKLTAWLNRLPRRA